MHLTSISPNTMKLEYTILEYLSAHDNGSFVDVTFLNEDYSLLMDTLVELKGKNLIVVNEAGRDFEAFGITNNRKKLVRAKIKLNGRAYFHSLKGIEKLKGELRGSRRKWNLTQFLNF